MTDLGIAAHRGGMLLGAYDADMVGERFDLGMQRPGAWKPEDIVDAIAFGPGLTSGLA